MELCRKRKNKLCTKCNINLPATIEYFYRHVKNKDGFQCWCKKCQNEATKKHRETERGREDHNAVNIKYRKTLRGHLQRVYSHIKQRCSNPKNKRYYCYGGRGIKNKFKTSGVFLKYVIEVLGITDTKQVKGLQIDRIDNDGHYEPGNIRWVTAKVNTANRNNKRSRFTGRFEK